MFRYAAAKFFSVTGRNPVLAVKTYFKKEGGFFQRSKPSTWRFLTTIECSLNSFDIISKKDRLVCLGMNGSIQNIENKEQKRNKNKHV